MTPRVNVQNGPSRRLAANDNTGSDQTKSEEDAGGRGGVRDTQTVPKSESAAGLSYDNVKYTLVVDEHAQLELVNLKDCLHGYNEHNDDSDTETVYQSANEEEDPEYEEERKRSGEAREQGDEDSF